MTKDVKKRQAGLMLNSGLTVTETARRLGCSARHIRRLKKNLDIKSGWIRSRETEHILWNYYYARGETLECIAYRFGVTPQLIYNTLTREL